jgi:hypothetical protein
LVKSSWGLAHPMSLTELALLDGRRPLPLGDVIELIIINSLIKDFILSPFPSYSPLWHSPLHLRLIDFLFILAALFYSILGIFILIS